MATDTVALTDTRASFTDTPAFSMAHTIGATDTRSSISDSPGVGLLHALGSAGTPLFVQQANNYVSATSNTVTMTNPTCVGNSVLLIVGAFTVSNNNVIGVPAGAVLLNANASTSDGTILLYQLPVTSAASSYTVTQTVSSYLTVVALEYSNVSAALQFATSTTASSGSNKIVATGSLTPAKLNEVPLAVVLQRYGNNAITARTWTEIALNNNTRFEMEVQAGPLTSSTSTALSASATFTTVLSGAASEALLTMLPPGNSVVDSRVAISDAPTFSVRRNPAPIDTRSVIADTPSISMVHAVLLSDTRATISDSPAILLTRNLSPQDNRSAVSDTAAFVATRYLTPSDSRSTFNDLPTVVDGHNIAVEDDRSATNDTAAFSNAVTVNVSDNRVSVSDSVAIPITHSIIAEDDKASISDSASVLDVRTLAVSDTRAPISDSLGFSDARTVSINDTRFGFSDSPQVSATHHLLATDVRNSTSDSPFVTQAIPAFAVDTRSPFSDSVTLAISHTLLPSDTSPGRSDSPVFFEMNFVAATDTRSAVSDTPAFSVARTLAVIDIAPSKSDAATLNLVHTILATDTKAAISDNPFVLDTITDFVIPVPDVRANFSDAPVFNIGHNIGVTDNRASFSDSPTVPQTIYISRIDSRAAFSDSVAFTRYPLVSDTRVAFNDSVSIQRQQAPAIQDTRPAISDSVSIQVARTPTVIETRSPFQDFPAIAAIPATKVSDTRQVFSDVPQLAITHNINIVDTASPKSDSPTEAIGIFRTWYLTATDTRAAFSDTPYAGFLFLPIDSRPPISDNPIITQIIGNNKRWYLTGTDTRAPFSDSAFVGYGDSLNLVDTRGETVSDAPNLVVTQNNGAAVLISATDSLQFRYDLPQINIDGNIQTAITDTRTQFNDSPILRVIKLSPPPPILGSALVPGSIDKKYVIYLGLQSADQTEFSVVPKGTFISTSAAGSQDQGVNSQTLHGFDIVHEFDFPVYADFPHPMYGNQTDERYDPNYNLTPIGVDITQPLANQSAQLWVHDAKLFMQAITDNTFFSAEYTDIFGAVTTGSPVNVYIGTANNPQATPADPSTYTWNPAQGTVVFNAPINAASLISIDGVPQAMAPELMIKHLFCDYANWDPVAMSLEVSNTLLPAYVGGRGSSVWQIAIDIASQTAPRFITWQIKVDEYGQINFYEDRLSATPVATLIDERDLYNIQYTYTTEDLANVVTADSVSNTNQALHSIAYSVPSINYNGQRAPYQIESNILLPTRGMSSATAISVMNTLTASALYQKSRPVLQMTFDILPNYLLQVGDKITIIERSIGLSGPYIIMGIDDKVSLGMHTMSLRVQQAQVFANFNMGLPSAVSNATQTTALTTPQALNGKTGIIEKFSINGQAAITAGTYATDSLGNAVIPVVSPGSAWTFSLTLDPTQSYDTALFHFIYMECGNSLSPSNPLLGNPLTPTGPLSSAMAIRLAGFPDGQIIKAAQVGGGYTLNSVHSSGLAVGTGEFAYIYNQIVVASNPATVPPGYNEVSATITNNAVAAQYLSTTTQYGIGYGPQYSGNYVWLPTQKQSYGYFCVMAVNAAGATTFLRIPFIVQL